MDANHFGVIGDCFRSITGEVFAVRVMGDCVSISIGVSAVAALEAIGGDREGGSFSMKVVETDRFRGFLEEECFGAFRGLAKLSLLEVQARGVFAIACLSEVA